MVLSKIFASIALLYGLTLAIATFTWKQPLFRFLHSEHAIGVTFAIAAALFLPFVITFTQLGLNGDESDVASPETDRRQARLANECPLFSWTWRGLTCFVFVTWIASSVVGNSIHPFFALSGAVSLLSGVWFAHVNPVARELFTSPNGWD